MNESEDDVVVVVWKHEIPGYIHVVSFCSHGEPRRYKKNKLDSRLGKVPFVDSKEKLAEHFSSSESLKSLVQIPLKLASELGVI
jgi:hypothetical protein